MFGSEPRLYNIESDNRIIGFSNSVDHYAAFSYTGENRPTITYHYEPEITVTDEEDNTTAVLHGRFAPLRLEGYCLPGSSVLRVRLEYESATGRVTTVAFPTPGNQNTSSASVPWRFLYPEEPDTAAPATTVLVRTPWGQLVEYTLEEGRLATITKQGVPTLAANDPTPASTGTIPTRTLTTSYLYEDDGRLKSTTFPDGSTTSYTYEEGERLDQMNPATRTRTWAGHERTTTYAYGPDRICTGETDPENQTISYPVAFHGAEPTPTGYEAEGVLTTSTFDQYGQLTKTETAGPTPEIATYQYRNEGNGVLESITARGVTQRFNYGELDLVTKRLTSYGTSTTYTRDDLGRIVETIRGQSTRDYRAVNATTQRAYDAAGHLIRERRHQAGVGWVETRWVYNEREQVTSTTQTGLAGSTPGTFIEGTTSHAYDAYGRLSMITSPAGVITTNTYDAASRLVTTQVSGSGTNRYAYDERARLVWQTDGDVGVWRGTYDGFGDLVQQWEPSGAYTEREYDQAGGITWERTYSDATKTMLLAATHYQIASYGGLLLQERTVEGGGSPATTISTTRSIDGAGRLTAINQTVNGQTRVTSFTYQPGTGLPASKTEASGAQTTYVYNEPGPWPSRVVTTEPATATHGSITTTTSVNRDAFGRAVLLDQAGDVLERVLDEAGNILVTRTGSTLVETQYDGHGRQTSVRHPAIGSETQYGYDPDGRLLTTLLTRDGGGTERTSYHYDQAGRLDQRTLPGALTETLSYYPDNTLATWQTRTTNSSGEQLVLTYEYDPANQLVRRTPSHDGFTMEELPEGMAPLDYGDVQEHDPLGRPLLLAHKNGPGAEDLDEETAITYAGYDTRGLPQIERLGTATIERQYNEQGNPRLVLLPQGLAASTSNAGYAVTYDADNHLTTATPAASDGSPIPDTAFQGTYSWGAGQRLTTATAAGISSSYGYEPANGHLATLDLATDDAALGGFTYTWHQEQKTARTSTTGDLALTSGLDWTAEHDAQGRLTTTSTGPQESLGSWTYGYGTADELRYLMESFDGRTSYTAGPQGRIATRTDPAGTTTTYHYDQEGRRTEDDHFHYEWDWRGQLVQTDVKESVPEHAGERILYAYDALGRLRTRTWQGPPDTNGERPFLKKRLLTWDGQRLAAEAGINHEGAVLWRTHYLPGPRLLDDAPLVLIEKDLLSSTPSTNLFALLRDEMGTVIGALEPRPGQPPALLARYLTTAYGQTHVELGPELAHVFFNPARTELDGAAQEPVEGESVAGAFIIQTTMALAPAALDNGLAIEHWTGTSWDTVPQDERIIGLDPADATALLILAKPAWPAGKRYRISMTPELRDHFGRALQEQQELELTIPADASTPQYERYLTIERDSAAAADNTLGGAFPGGQPLTFQGLWTDPVTGLHYARNRWLDSRNASWLSPDQLGPVDSQNLYAAFGLNPVLFTDPEGKRVYLSMEKGATTADVDTFLMQLMMKTGVLLVWDGERIKDIGFVKHSRGVGLLGSPIARELLLDAVRSYSKRIYFVLVRSQKFIKGYRPGPVYGGISPEYIMDVSDWETVDSGEINPQSLDMGMAALHEMAHHFLGTTDPTPIDYLLGGPHTGETVDYINRIRRQLGLDMRTDYQADDSKFASWCYQFESGLICFTNK